MVTIHELLAAVTNGVLSESEFASMFAYAESRNLIIYDGDEVDSTDVNYFIGN